ncbi:MAG: hypothetical protein M0Z76_06375 [Gammaproteobacteria bacterium]|nr:hypothetical protein [Gammaproteobacteria bacterium]
MTTSPLQSLMADVDREIRALEQAPSRDACDLQPLVEHALLLANRLMLAFAGVMDHPLDGLGVDADPLEVFRVFVKGEPSLNAIRDNVRELVYYRNCLAAGRADALPARPAAMAVRTVRHIYLYLRTRAIKEHGLEGA